MFAILNFFSGVNFTVKSRYFSRERERERERGGTMKEEIPGKRKVTTAY